MSDGQTRDGRARIRALDAFRGLTVAAMLLVNNPGSWGAIYAPLEHAEWNGWTPTDLIFPFFLFIVGITTELSLRRRRDEGQSKSQLLRYIALRGVLIVLVGLALNAFPFFAWSAIDGIPDPSLLDRIVYRMTHLRYTGVLQRIGVVYLFAAAISLYAATRRLILVILLILFGYWTLMTVVRVPDNHRLGVEVFNEPEQTLAAWSDRAIVGTPHMWRTGRWDPEGPLSTLPAIATALFGALAGRFFLSNAAMEKKVRMLALAGISATALGLLWGMIFPINKNLWTSSYVVFTAGAASLLLAGFIWLIDLRGANRISEPFVVYGSNPLIAFVGSGVMARVTDSLIRWRTPSGKKTTLHLSIYDHIFATWLPPKAASLAYAIAFVVLWYFILLILARRRIYVKI